MAPSPGPRLLQEGGSLPFLTQPHDALREGLVTLKDGAAPSHPVELIQKAGPAAAEAERLQMLQNVYGSALPARIQIERQILDRCGGVDGAGGTRAAPEQRVRRTSTPLPPDSRPPPGQGGAPPWAALLQAGRRGDERRAGHAEL